MIKVKYLSDSDILNFNNKIKVNSNYSVIPVYSANSSHPNIRCYLNKPDGIFSNIYNPLKNSDDIIIELSYNFSISSNRIDDFFKIFKRECNCSIGNKFVHYNDNTEILKNIDFDPKFPININESIDVTNHNIKGKEYTRYSYKFYRNLSSILVYITLLENSVEFLNLMWAYNDKGVEYSLLKYPIGSIVCRKENQHVDYIIMDYNYDKNYDNFTINYFISEIIGRDKVVIKYGMVDIAKESELRYSRNDLIDGILN